VKIRAVRPPDGVWLRLWQDTGEERVPMLLWREETDVRVYQTEMTVPGTPGLLWYYFIVSYGGREYYYGNNTAGQGGFGQVYDRDPVSYQITVFAPGVSTPHWFKEAIMYQIFVDRFHNGNADGIIANPPRGSLIHPYWDDIPFYVRDTHTGRIFAYDFFGGNLAGIMAKFSYLRSLGVSVIYLNPIFESPSNHKYDTGDYKTIDPMFGDNALFKQLCEKAVELGIAVILDGVFSHTGSDSRYFNKEGRYPDTGAYQSPASPYYSWYRFSEYPDKYESWWGIDTLPNVNELDPSYIDYMIEGQSSVLKQWLKAGIKGWRLDVADELPDSFIQRLRQVMKAHDPETVLIGEVWEDASRKESYGSTRHYLLGAELDSVTNYPFRDILLGFILGTMDAAAVRRAFASLYENYPREHFFAAMNMLGSHDVPRILTLLGEPPSPDAMTIIDQARYRLPPERKSLAVARLKLLVLWQMTFPGVPCIYYGDEAGMEGYTDPFNRGTFPWGAEDQDLLAWYRTVTGLRQRYAVLRTGEWIALPVSGDVYGYVRLIEHGWDAFGQTRPNNMAVVLLNRNPQEEAGVSFDLGAYWQGFLYDGLGGPDMPLPEGRLAVTLRPLEGRLFLGRREEEPAFPRSSGILLHPTSLPSAYGIGDMGPGAYRFIDWLAASRQKLWQILPLNPPGYGESPYQSVSAFAGNWWLLSPELMAEDGLLAEQEIADPPSFPVATVDFTAMKRYKGNLLRVAFRRFRENKKKQDYHDFLIKNSAWLENYALFMALQHDFGGLPWNEWEAAAAGRNESALAGYRLQLAEEIDYHRFLQYLFFRQWTALKQYANRSGVQIIGDLPIFVSHDSSDVWANPHLFELDPNGAPTVVAGVPPDYFSATGQLWGNPHYNWQAMAEDDYAWWLARFHHILTMVDSVRIDHFRGFDAYWQVGAAEPTAENGAWVKGPGARLFAGVQKKFGQLPVIAEDLGIITPSVERLRDQFNYPGMKILHFLFEAGDVDKRFLETLERNCAIYTGTHDNDTTLGWYRHCREKRPDVAERLNHCLELGGEPERTICWRLIESAFASNASIAMVPLQDYLSLGTQARMNTPGTVGGNWEWRLDEKTLTQELAGKIGDLSVKYNR
jgi:4-alpha-glucanotransferase